jgi:hypothetical protein
MSVTLSPEPIGTACTRTFFPPVVRWSPALKAAVTSVIQAFFSEP